MVLYENYLICIFMNINENFSNERFVFKKNKECTYKITNVSPTMCPSVSDLVLMLRHCTFTIRYNMKIFFMNIHEF